MVQTDRKQRPGILSGPETESWRKPDESVDTALADILPYAVIGMDQAIANFDDREALRLEGLIRMADPNAPALARVKSDLEKMKTRQAQAETDKASADELAAENEAKAKDDAAKAKEEAAKKAKDEAAKTAQTAAAPVAVQAPAPVVQAPAPVVQAPAPAPVVQAPAAKAAIVPLQTPQPDYPREALIAGTKGEVVAEISINGAGDVTGVRIISAIAARRVRKERASPRCAAGNTRATAKAPPSAAPSLSIDGDSPL